MFLFQIEDTGGSHKRAVYRLGTSNHIKRNWIHTMDGANSVSLVTRNCRFFFLAQQPALGHGLLSHEVSRSHTRRTIVGRTPLDELLARHRDLYLTTHNTHNRQTSMPWWDSNTQSQQASGRRSTP
jgi:hypothetical protein